MKVADKRILSVIKTTLNPSTKLAVLATSPGFRCVSAGGVPPIIHKYEGSRGRTQGEKNDNRPARADMSAKIKELSVIT